MLHLLDWNACTIYNKWQQGFELVNKYMVPSENSINNMYTND